MAQPKCTCRLLLPYFSYSKTVDRIGRTMDFITILTFSVGKIICLHTVPVVVWQISSCRRLLKESQPPGNVGSAPCQAGMVAAAAAIGLTEAPPPVTATLATAASEARNQTWASSGVWCLPAYPFTVLQAGSSAKAEACFCMEAH